MKNELYIKRHCRSRNALSLTEITRLCLSLIAPKIDNMPKLIENCIFSMFFRTNCTPKSNKKEYNLMSYFPPTIQHKKNKLKILLKFRPLFKLSNSWIVISLILAYLLYFFRKININSFLLL